MKLSQALKELAQDCCSFIALDDYTARIITMTDSGPAYINEGIASSSKIFSRRELAGRNWIIG